MSRCTTCISSLLMTSDNQVVEFGTQSCSNGIKVVPRFIGDSHKILQVAAGSATNYFLTCEMRIFAIGSNQFGTLCMPSSAVGFSNVFFEINISHILLECPRIKLIASGVAGSFAVLTENGKVYTCGENPGRLGPRDSLLPIENSVFNDDVVKHISIGGCISIVTTMTGALYSWGYNSNAESTTILGHGVNCSHTITEPTILDYFVANDIAIDYACAGRMHCLAVDIKGTLYGWGSNKFGQLGCGDGRDRPSPEVVIVPDLDSRITHVSCGWYHSLLRTSAGLVYSAGNHLMGALGRVVDVATNSDKVFMPVPLIDHYLFTEVHAGSYHSVILAKQSSPSAEAGVVATCGVHSDGQLGGGTAVAGVYGCLLRKHLEIVDVEAIAKSPPPPPVVEAVVPSQDDTRGKKPRKSERSSGSTTAERPLLGFGNYSRDDEQQEDNDEEDEDEDENEGDDDDEEEEEGCYVRLDFGDRDCDGGSLTAFSEVADMIIASEECRTAAADDLLNVIIANHYGLAKLAPLADSLAACVFDIKSRLRLLHFVSCSLLSPETSDEWSGLFQYLKECPNFEEVTLDQASFHSSPTSDSPDDIALGQFACGLFMIPSFKTLFVEGLGDEGGANLFNFLISETSCNVKRLTISSASFGIDVFRLISQYLSLDRGLEELSLPDHEQINNESMAILAQGLRVNTKLRKLDVHVSELGHIGVEEEGLVAVIAALEANNKSSLHDLDVSGDDGAPEVSKRVQSRLTKCLVGAATRGGHDVKTAKLPVYRCHSDDNY